MKQELLALHYTMEIDGKVRRSGDWWVSIDPHFDDFNREIIEPNINETYPEGAVGIRTDDDFWQVAALPLKFRELTIQEIVPILWPDIKDPWFGEDTEAYELTEKT